MCLRNRLSPKRSYLIQLLCLIKYQCKYGNRQQTQEHCKASPSNIVQGWCTRPQTMSYCNPEPRQTVLIPTFMRLPGQDTSVFCLASKYSQDTVEGASMSFAPQRKHRPSTIMDLRRSAAKIAPLVLDMHTLHHPIQFAYRQLSTGFVCVGTVIRCFYLLSELRFANIEPSSAHDGHSTTCLLVGLHDGGDPADWSALPRYATILCPLLMPDTYMSSTHP